MRNQSPRIPEVADEIAMLDLMTDLLALEVRREPQPQGFRIFIDSYQMRIMTKPRSCSSS